MKMKLCWFAALALMAIDCQFSLSGQVTNFTPVQMTVDRVNDPALPNPGVFVRFSSDVGRLYRLESSATLTNWTLIEQVVGDATNMEFFIPVTNMTVIYTNGTGTNSFVSLPGFSTLSVSRASVGDSVLISDGGTSGDLPIWPPLPYPWDPIYQPGVRRTLTAQYGTLEEQSLMEFSDSPATTNSPADAMFYRVVCPEDRIQFPNWNPFIDQYLSFNVWTPLQGGTFRVVLYRDGQSIYTNVAAVPSSGNIGVHDSGYDPAEWPYTGYYTAGTWELHITVTPAGGSTNSATAVVQKRQRTPSWNYRRGITVQMDPSSVFASGIWATKEIDYDLAMQTVFLGCYSGASQVDLNGAYKDIVSQTPETLRSSNDWTQLGLLIRGGNAASSNSPVGMLSDMHYFGLGSGNGLGTNLPGQNLLLGDLQMSMLRTNPLFYAAIDGCTLGDTRALLKAFVGYGRPHPRSQFAAEGWQPAFSWGWKGAKPVAYLNQETAMNHHFSFLVDFYSYLVQADPYTGLMVHVLGEAVAFAKDPNGEGINPAITHNAQGNDFIYVGCTDCFFDEF